MSYATGEAAILTLIRALSGYDTNNTDRQDWSLLGKGKAAVYAILRPGPWTNQRATITSSVRQWRTVIEVWRRYIDDSKPVALQSDVVTIVEQLEKYPTLNGASGVLRAEIVGGGNMEEIEIRTSKVLWAKWDIYCDWSEEKVITYA